MAVTVPPELGKDADAGLGATANKVADATPKRQRLRNHRPARNDLRVPSVGVIAECSFESRFEGIAFTFIGFSIQYAWCESNPEPCL
jgi:hypothetical protein